MSEWLFPASNRSAPPVGSTWCSRTSRSRTPGRKHSGIEEVRSAMSGESPTPIVVITDTTLERRSGVEADIAQFVILEKPFGINELLEATAAASARTPDAFRGARPPRFMLAPSATRSLAKSSPSLRSTLHASRTRRRAGGVGGRPRAWYRSHAGALGLERRGFHAPRLARRRSDVPAPRPRRRGSEAAPTGRSARRRWKRVLGRRARHAR